MLCRRLLLQNQRLCGEKQESHLTGMAVGHRDKWVEATWQLGLALFSKGRILSNQNFNSMFQGYCLFWHTFICQDFFVSYINLTDQRINNELSPLKN